MKVQVEVPESKVIKSLNAELNSVNRKLAATERKLQAAESRIKRANEILKEYSNLREFMKSHFDLWDYDQIDDGL